MTRRTLDIGARVRTSEGRRGTIVWTGWLADCLSVVFDDDLDRLPVIYHQDQLISISPLECLAETLEYYKK